MVSTVHIDRKKYHFTLLSLKKLFYGVRFNNIRLKLKKTN